MKQGTRSCLGCLGVFVALIVIGDLILSIIFNRNEDYTFQIGKPDEFYVRIKTKRWDSVADIFWGKSLDDIRNKTNHIMVRKAYCFYFENSCLSDTIYIDEVYCENTEICRSTNYIISFRKVPDYDREYKDTTYYYCCYNFGYKSIGLWRGGISNCYEGRSYFPLDIDWK